MSRPDWTEQEERPRLIRASERPAFEVGQRVAVVTLDDPPETLQGEIRAIDGGLAVVFIAGRSERVAVEQIKPLDSQPFKA